MPPDDTSLVLSVRGVHKNFYGLRPLRLESLDLGRGERIAISGLDVSAAEVFVNVVTGATRPDEGEVRVFGRTTASIASEADWFTLLDHFGIVSHRAVLLDGSTLAQNLALPFTLDLEPIPDGVRARVERLAEEIGLAPDGLDRVAGDAPTEDRMRVLLGRALALDPQILLLEHPTLPMAAGAVPRFAADVERIATARDLAVIAATEDAVFAKAVAGGLTTLDAATGVIRGEPWWKRWT